MPFQSYDPSVRAFPGTSDRSKAATFGDFFGMESDGTESDAQAGRYDGRNAPYFAGESRLASQEEQTAALTAQVAELGEEIKRLSAAARERASSVPTFGDLASREPSNEAAAAAPPAPPKLKVRYSTPAEGGSPALARSQSLVSGRV